MMLGVIVRTVKSPNSLYRKKRKVARLLADHGTKRWEGGDRKRKRRKEDGSCYIKDESKHLEHKQR